VKKIDLQVKMIIMHLIDNDHDDAVVPRHKRKRLTIDDYDIVISACCSSMTRMDMDPKIMCTGRGEERGVRG
jgi:hypothetical protein